MKSTHAQAAAAIRAELKTTFTGVKFKVRSSSASMTSSVDVYWTDGPSTEKVNNVIGKYQKGSFDGMTDCYNYDNVNKDLPQVRYTFSERTMSDAVAALLESELGIDINDSGNDYNNSRKIYSEFCQRDFYEV